MATGNIFLGTASGRIGSIVLRRSRGKQVTSPKVTPANPKSEAQCKQRMVFATSVSSAARLRTIVDHSFEGIKYGQDSVNYFTKLNTAMLRAGMNYDGSTEMPDNNNYLVKGAKGLARMPFQISRGQLSFPQYAFATSFAATSAATEKGAELLNAPHDAIIAPSITDAGTYAAVLGVIGLQPGEQLTLVAGLTDNNVDAEYAPTGAVNYTTYVEFARIIFKPASEVDFSTPFSLVDEYGGFNSNIINFEKSSNWIDKVLIETSTSGNAIIAPVTNGLDLVMIALIRSARGAQGWLRSSAKFVLGDDSDALAWQVWPSYGKQENVGTSHKYLNQPYNNSDTTPTDEAFAPQITSFEVASPTATSITISEVKLQSFSTLPQFATVEVKDASANVLVSQSTPYGETMTVTTSSELVDGQTYDVTVTIQGVSKTQQFTKNS